MSKPFAELVCHTETWAAFSLDSCYDTVAQELVLRAIVPDNTWLSIGFGATMRDTDMISWTVKNGVG